MSESKKVRMNFGKTLLDAPIKLRKLTARDNKYYLAPIPQPLPEPLKPTPSCTTQTNTKTEKKTYSKTTY